LVAGGKLPGRYRELSAVVCTSLLPTGIPRRKSAYFAAEHAAGACLGAGGDGPEA